jgi:cell division protein FtsA
VKNKERIICGLDIGTCKICLVVLRSYPDGKVDLVASGFSKSAGLAKGTIVNPSEVVASISKARMEVKSRSRIPANSVVVGISGNHIKSHRFSGVVQVQGKNGEVTARDMENAIRAASIPLFPEQEIIHILPQDFNINGRGGIKNPVGLAGTQLGVNLHVIACDSALCQSLINVVNKSGIEAKRIILQSIASGEAVLTPEEKFLGSVVIDIGGGITDIAIFAKDSIPFVSVIPVGGMHFTRDLAEGISASREEAERIKIEFGSVLPEQIAPEEEVSVQGLGLRGSEYISRKKVCEYLHDRGAELMELIGNEIVRSGMREELVAGAVFTGGGSMMAGLLEMAEHTLKMPVRQGLPLEFGGLPKELMHPIYSSAVGLAIFEAQKSTQLDFQDRIPSKPPLIEIIMDWLKK